MTRRSLIALPVAAGLGCQSQTPRGEVTLRLGMSANSPSVSPLFLAEEQGYFKAEGIRLDIDRASFTGSHVPALASGKLDLALLAATPALVNAIARSAVIRIVAARDRASARCGGWGQFQGRRTAFPGGLRDFAELRGKKIAYSTPGSVTDFALDLVLESAAISRKELEPVALSPPEALAALNANRIDALVTMGFTGLAPKSPEQAYFPGVGRVFPSQQVSFVAFGSGLLGANKDLGLRFLRALLRATREFVGGRNPHYLEEWARQSGVDVSNVASGCRDHLSPDGKVDLSSITRYLDWAHRREFLESLPRAEGLADLSFLSELERAGSLMKAAEEPR